MSFIVGYTQRIIQTHLLASTGGIPCRIAPTE